ncbi:HNH endonuclease [Agromyces atrinae]|uniref:HNH endonuclease signature motif containing protein n=1 Tax=Agromyces atrinae TaxID=592376 RepID=UPI001F5972E3|nr:HNH endonuclease signature motif containing protein [Agromyces atrinae]MCI2957220.1 HNH endonuclease [Agromyces atrinae]
MAITPPAAALCGIDEALTALVEEWDGALVGVVRDSLSGPSSSSSSSSALGAASTDVRSMSDAGLVRVNDAIASARRTLATVHARVAAELAERSTTVGEENIAKTQGFASVERLIAHSTGDGFSAASRLVSVGRATAPRASFTGEVLPARYPHIAAALDAGTISIDAAAAITSFLDSIRVKATPNDLDDAERFLIDRAPHVGVDGITRLTKRLTAHLDPDGVKPREDELRAGRNLHIWEDHRGYIRMKGALDPATGAPIKIAIDALVTAELHRTRGTWTPTPTDTTVHAATHPAATDPATTSGTGAGDSSSAHAPSGSAIADSATAETRSIPQLNADALADIARLALGSTDSPPALRTTTVVARIHLDDLLEHTTTSDADPGDGAHTATAATSATASTSGTASNSRTASNSGTASGSGSGSGSGSSLRSGSGRTRTPAGWGTIDGIDHPVSAATIRQLAAAAGVIPMILGGPSEVLDLGRTTRLFTTAQKLALTERDGGCAFPGCTRPPGYTQTHHIHWWKRDTGPTDLTNGILLCAFHHHRIHDDGWTITIHNNHTWFTPPPHIDPTQTPRPGNTNHTLNPPTPTPASALAPAPAPPHAPEPARTPAPPPPLTPPRPPRHESPPRPVADTPTRPRHGTATRPPQDTPTRTHNDTATHPSQPPHDPASRTGNATSARPLRPPRDASPSSPDYASVG